MKLFSGTYYNCISKCRFALVLLFVLTAFAAGAQRNDFVGNRLYADQKRWHLGFSVGMHFQDLKFTHNGYTTPEGENWFAEIPSYSPGFCVNVLADLRLHQYFNLRFSPGMYFGNKTAHFIEHNSGTIEKQDVKSAYVVLPLDLKISGDRYKNVRPYVTAGIMGSLDVSKKRSDFLQFKPFDTYLTIGMGCDFYLPFFKLNPEIKFCFGLSDVLKHDRLDLADDPAMMKITESLSKVKNNMIVLTFYFE
ncbi:MAG: PorT family protein [Prevotella sp.]|nr:PorT family protein [Prevotella sp.]MCM1074994.1 PorT family protein [Ruminococcus sp.]